MKTCLHKGDFIGKYQYHLTDCVDNTIVQIVVHPKMKESQFVRGAIYELLRVAEIVVEDKDRIEFFYRPEKKETEA